MPLPLARAGAREGRTTPKPHAGGRASRFYADFIRTLHIEPLDLTLAKCAARCQARTGVPISLSSTERLVQELDLRRKKKDASRR